MKEADFSKYLTEEGERIGISLKKREIEKLSAFYELLMRWGEKFNLIGIKDERKICRTLFCESLLPELFGWRLAGALLDVGSGAGFPGIPLAVRHPTLKITLLEPNKRKCAFLREAILSLNLKNATCINSRLEDLLRGGVGAVKTDALRPPYDFFTFRAFGSVHPYLDDLKELGSPDHIVFAYIKSEQRKKLFGDRRIRYMQDTKLLSSSNAWLVAFGVW